jgi:TonB family protein
MAGGKHASDGRSTTGTGDGTTVVIGGKTARDANAGVVTPQASDGAVRPNPTAPMADPGPTSTDTPKRADKPSDDTNPTAASHDQKSGPFEVTPPGSGGPQRAGVDGKPATGQLATSSGSGTGATTWGGPRGARDLAVTAEAQDPYFRQLFARLGKTIVFPHDLMLQLRTGRPIAELVLRADGTITQTAIAVPCGTPGFDRELLRAIGTLKRLPAVPVALLHGKPEIRVRVEWAFDPGILR